MPIVTFWSNTKKETAQTLSMIAIASHIAVENNSKILIIDTNFNESTIKNAYWQETNNNTRKMIKELSGGKIDIGSGIEGLAKVLSSGRAAGNVISDYSKVVFKGRLEVILSFMSTNEIDQGRIKSVYKELIKLASGQYDYVFVDVPKGLDDPFVNEILNMTDVVVYNMTQRLIDINDYAKLKSENSIFKTNKVMPLIGKYDKYSKYTKKNIARNIGEKFEIPAVSYNTLFFEAANEGGIGDYFLKFRKSLISSTDRNASFIDEVEKAANRVIMKTQEVLMMR